jgi:hypothetical protein
MSGDELVALVASVIFGLAGWRSWLAGLLFLNRLSRRPATQLIGWLLPPVAAGVMLFVLIKWSSQDVQTSPLYIFFYMAMWFGWTGLWNGLLPYMGLSCRDDALERDNTAAGLAIAGWVLGLTCAFAGANIGNGPGWWVVIFCALLSSGAMAILWIIDNAITKVCEAITIDRDISAGLRTGCFSSRPA